MGNLPGRRTTLKKVSIWECRPSLDIIQMYNMTKAKITGNYANSVMAKTDAVRNGFDEAIMLDPEGYVAECTGENIIPGG